MRTEIEDRIAFLEKSERNFRSFKDGIDEYYIDHLREIRSFKAITNIMVALVVLLFLIAAPLASFQCWKVWNGYGVVVVELNGTTKCDQCNQNRDAGNSKREKWDYSVSKKPPLHTATDT
jgi:hypothetical protein